MAQFNMSALGTLVLKARLKVLPFAKMRVPSALGVSAASVALPVPAEVAGDVQLSFATAVPAAFSAVAPLLLLLLLLPAAAEPVALLLLPLAWVAAVLPALSPPPPPPHPASARDRVESRSSCDFINL
ncbi:hypothetical protein [Paraburkholderia ultramafica]|uniref:hypothetical protein n=1 Tax=Paraburkholderia ultramafica TaxID=1544867 RepID=UPI001FE94D5F|nr:hypothetical protein [Paraburkholderia ultramafica]